MQDPLRRLYRSKLVLLATVLSLIGFGLLLLGLWAGHAHGWSWLTSLLPLNVGLAIFTTGLLGVGWQYVDGADSEARDTERLKRVLAESAPAMRDAVIGGFAFEPADLARVATPQILDQVAINSLGIRLGDPLFAAELYDDIVAQAIDQPERIYNAAVSIRLASPAPGQMTPSRRDRLYEVTVRWEYTITPLQSARRFVCTSNSDEFRELQSEGGGTSVWFFRPKPGLSARDSDAFELLDFTVDGRSHAVRRTTKQDGQAYTVSIGHDLVNAKEPVAVAYSYRTIVEREGNLLRLRVDQPTHGLRVDFDYSRTDIQRVVVLDYLPGAERTRISDRPEDLRQRVVGLDFDGWALPRTGVAFVWTEPTPSKLKSSTIR